ncbi:MAG TPA: carbohydrate porin [Acetobacteraceae bacterium]|jgi:porin|nr:carbohydrate porin [Acetobacteraceae bacterium]
MHWLNRVAVLLVLYAVPGACLVQADDPPAFEAPLIKAGVTPSFIYNGVAAADLAGGVKRGGAFENNLHVQLALDGAKLAGLTGVTGWLDALWIFGSQPNLLAGAAQGVSNISAAPALRLYEAWLQYNTPQNRFSILAGRYDLNAEFYNLRSAALFLNSSFGIGADFGVSGIAGPSNFPNTSLAVRFAYKPIPNGVLQFAVLDGAPVNAQLGSSGPFNPHNGLLLVAEADYMTPSSDQFLIGRQPNQPSYDDKVAVGAWYYTASFADLGSISPSGAPVFRQGEAGAYLLLDQLLFKSQSDPNQRVTGFVQLGAADQRVDRFGTYIGAGLTVASPLQSRPDDQLGVAMAMDRNGSHYLEGQQRAGLPVTAAETVIEMSYLAQVASWLSMQPDLQYMIHPNTDPRLRDALVAQLQIQIKF